MEELEGIVEEIIYRNDDNGYAVVSVRCAGGPQTVVGTLPFIKQGERVRVLGTWTTHATFGRQLKASTYETIVPTKADEIERYLASGLIKGIGEMTAKAIVECFGDDTLNVLANDPGRLREVEGIGPKRAAVIAENYAQQQETREVMMFLQRYQVPPALSMRIIKAYGGNAITVLRANPYQLVRDVPGVGFRTADRIALSMGVAPDDPNRLRAGLTYTLWDAAGAAGHVFLPKEKLVEAACGILQAPEEEVVNELAALVLSGEVRVEERTDCTAVYHHAMLSAEKEVALQLILLQRAAQKQSIDASDAALDAFEDEQGITFEQGQRRAIALAAQSPVVVITGGPGTGKTTVINCVIRLMQRAGLTVSLAAPTGRAAKRMTEATGQEAKTIHRLLEYAAGEDEGLPLFGKTEEDPLKADVVIVDEMSMVDLQLMRSLLKALRPGTRLVLVGDADQLPSVGAGNVLRDIIDSRVLPVARLTEVFRQAAQSHIVVNAHRINSGQMPIIRNRDTDFFFEKRDNLYAIADSVCALVTTRLPGFYHIDPIRDIQVLAPMKKGDAGVWALNRMLQERLNPPARHKKERIVGDNRFREGDKVMQVRNNYQAEWTRGAEREEEGLGVFNGDIGIIECIDDSGLTVYFDDERRVVYDETMLQDLELAYAMTIHKSQGSEFSTVVLALLPGPPQMMVRNLLYTAVTRAKDRVVMVGSETVLARMVENNKTAHRYTALGDRLAVLDSMTQPDARP